MKKRILLIAPLFLSAGLTAKPEINTQALEACSLIENDFNRLLCYDNIMAGKSIGSARSESKIPQHAKAHKQAAKEKQATAPKDDFGLEHKEIVKEQEDEIRVTVTKAEKAPHGELVITMDNGQIWRQIGSERFRLKEGDKVVISRGMFNSFLLKLEGQNRTIRVKRTD